jgi:hypothetical protein
MADRSNLPHSEYYQKLADVIRIFWEDYKAKLDKGEIEFAHLEPGFYSDTKVKVIDKYTRAVDLGLKKSWHKFLTETEDGYTKQLIKETNELARVESRISKHGVDLDLAGNLGISTGSSTVMHLVSYENVFGKDFKSHLAALMLSKVDLSSAESARRKIGIPDMSGTKGNHKLIDDRQGNATKLDKNALKAMGYGEAFGCPAGIPASESTQIYLGHKGVENPAGTMLGEFAQMTSREFNEDVREKFKELYPEDQERWVHPDELAIMRGEKPWSRHPEGVKPSSESVE